jgi:hypothetical protein
MGTPEPKEVGNRPPCRDPRPMEGPLCDWLQSGTPGGVKHTANDFARAAYEEAMKRRPGRIVTLRQKTRVVADSRRQT